MRTEQDRLKFLKQTTNNLRRSGKTHASMIALAKAIKKSETAYYYSTKNREWFKVRFKDANGFDVKVEQVEGTEFLYKLSL